MAGGLGTRPKLFCGSCATRKIRALEEIAISPQILLPCSNGELNFICSFVSMSYDGLGGYSNRLNKAWDFTMSLLLLSRLPFSASST